MKKILGISLVALFAAAPMMAGAADLPEVTIVAADAQNNEKGDANKMATVSYVKGAYGAIRTVVNSKAEQSDMTSVQSNVEALQSAVGDSTKGLLKDVADLKSGGYITKDVDDLTNYTTTTDMNSAISDAIDSALDSYTTTDDLGNTYATKAGVTATISASEITATVPALADWNSSTVTNVAVTAGITGHAYVAE